MAKDFNNLKTWLPKKLKERRMTVEDLAKESGVSRRSIYYWIDDVTRPTSQMVKRIVDALSKRPMWGRDDDGNIVDLGLQKIETIEMESQFSTRKLGRPPKSEGSTRGVSVKSRK